MAVWRRPAEIYSSTTGFNAEVWIFYDYTYSVVVEDHTSARKAGHVQRSVVYQLQQPEFFTIWMAVWRRSAEIYSSTTGFNAEVWIFYDYTKCSRRRSTLQREKQATYSAVWCTSCNNLSSSQFEWPYEGDLQRFTHLRQVLTLKCGSSTTTLSVVVEDPHFSEKSRPRTAQCGVSVATTWALRNLNGLLKAICRDLPIYDRFYAESTWTWGKKRTSSKECFWCFEACIWVHGASNGNDPEMPWSRMVGNLVFWFPTCPPSRFKELLPALASSKTMA